jgi:hypothetical protein
MFYRLMGATLLLACGATQALATLTSTVGVPNPGGVIFEQANDNSPISIQSNPVGGLFAEAKAHADYGVLRAYAYSRWSPAVEAWESSAFATFTDDLTLIMPTAGYLQVTVATDGSRQYPGFDQGNNWEVLDLEWTLYGPGSTERCNIYGAHGNANPNSSCTLRLGLEAGASTVRFVGRLAVATLGRTGEAYLNLYNTSKVTGLGAVDNTGAMLAGTSIASASGTVYPDLNPAAVPEPATWLCAGFGLLATCLTRSARKR